jgi:hypothetical protein
MLCFAENSIPREDCSRRSVSLSTRWPLFVVFLSGVKP